MADVSVRPARTGDEDEVTRIQLDTWRSAYADILPAGVLESLSADGIRPVWAQSISAPPSARHRVLVAQEGQWLVGFLAQTPQDDPEPDDPAPQSTVAIALMLVEPRWGRRGHGSRLLAAAVDFARGDGMTRGVTWVPEADATSRAFYRSAGWAEDGLVRVLDTGAGEVREVRLHVSLEES